MLWALPMSKLSKVDDIVLCEALTILYRHQRPDAWKYIRVQCKYLTDYPQA